MTYIEYGNEEVIPESSVRPSAAPAPAPAPVSAPAPVAIPAIPAIVAVSFAVGEKCQALYSVDGEWYNAVINSVVDGGKSVNVTFIDYGNEEVVPINNLKKGSLPAPVALPIPAAIQPVRQVQLPFSQQAAPRAPVWNVGDACEARFSEDGVWYPAAVAKISADLQSYTVVYTEYGNSEILPVASLRPLQKEAAPQVSFSLSLCFSFVALLFFPLLRVTRSLKLFFRFCP